ncbi:MAG: nucleotidyl transferase AbiEii/AbiGii toxin family protein [Betaproteobacteria bacterium]|nr:nucleotidyl transferase AbiEii/AbiGii toxin family protein [Betaproteobacteria bacterium]
MESELEVLKDVSARLERAGFRYMLTGSMALTCYAPLRMTRDIDLVVELEPRDAGTVIALFATDYYISGTDVARALGEHGMFNVLHNRAAVKVDLIVRKNEPFRLEELGRRKRMTVAGFDVWVVSREDLILSKLVWAKDSRSEMQLRDVRALLAGDVDQDYLDRWSPMLSVAQDLEACKNAGHDS